MITALGSDTRLVLDKLTSGGEGMPRAGEIPFDIPLAPAKLRRMNRYSRLAVGGAISALRDSRVEVKPENAFRYGTIFTTGYGAMVSNVEFVKSVADDQPDLCSPSLFAGTVPNSCVGQVCIQLGLKGPSTVLVGGNTLLYSKMLLQSGKADLILAGAVEEYSEDLFSSLAENPFAKGIEIREATVALVLEREEGDKESYCTVGNSAAAGLEAYPLVKKVGAANAERAVFQALKECESVNGRKADAFINSANGGYFDEIELRAAKKALPGAQVVSEVKKSFGEAMGSAFTLNAAAAALYLKHGLRGYRNIIASGYDTIGNYHCVMLYTA
jgi:3-oxoacyl-(acyl-carrier-protein) synthase